MRVSRKCQLTGNFGFGAVLEDVKDETTWFCTTWPIVILSGP